VIYFKVKLGQGFSIYISQRKCPEKWI